MIQESQKAKMAFWDSFYFGYEKGRIGFSTIINKKLNSYILLKSKEVGLCYGI